LKLTILFVVVVLKPDPVMVTVVPTGPDIGDTLEMATGTETVKVFHVADELPTVTFNGPVVAPLGTVATNWVALAEDTVAAVPLNVTALPVAVVLKPEPVIVTAVPTMPLVGDTLAIANDAPTVKLFQVADELPTVTFTGPLVAPLGTFTTN
jgi:hypothetical protein